MIAKSRKANPFGGCIRYVMGKDNARSSVPMAYCWAITVK